TGNHYYALAYGQKTTSNFETTAQSGVALGSLATGGTVCGANILGIGIFNGGGFIQDGLSASTVPTGYPDPSAGAGGYPGVQTVFGKINTAPNGAGTYDDLTLATINGLNTTVTFHPTSDPPGF
ncbi:MAG TPA: hypothetical protein PK881_03240, partial [Leptospiraceae bacterium]|nr:hypothetical protein [Leptospiraceae bacterium]